MARTTALAPQSALEQALRAFEPALHREFTAALLRRLGLQPAGNDRDGRLAKAFWIFLETSKAPFEQTFFDWYGGALSADRASRSPSAGLYDGPAFVNLRAAFDELSPVPGLRLRQQEERNAHQGEGDAYAGERNGERDRDDLGERRNAVTAGHLAKEIRREAFVHHSSP